MYPRNARSGAVSDQMARGVVAVQGAGAGTSVPLVDVSRCRREPAREVEAWRWTGLKASPILLVDDPGADDSGVSAPETFEQYVASTPDGVGDAVPLDELVRLCAAADLRGRGGAGFPLAVKLEAVRDAAEERTAAIRVVANGEEGEPASAKDRYLLSRRPHLVIDGLLIAASALRAERAYIYVSEDDLVERLRGAAARWTGSLPIEVFHVERGYVAGEETAVVRALSGGPAKPTAKPPRPYSHGVDGRPTLVSNVETLAHLARLVRLGLEHITVDGTDEERGTTLLTIVPDSGRAQLVEVPFGVTVREVLREAGLLKAERLPAVLTGGFFGGFLPEAKWDVSIGHAPMKAVGAGLGCGSFLVLTTTCPIEAARELLAYFNRENSRQCGVCINGTAAMFQALERLCAGTVQDSDHPNLLRWSSSLPGRGACALLDGAARIVSTMFEHHESLVLEHLEAPCGDCRRPADANPRTRFAVGIPA